MRLGIDLGGTKTEIVALDASGGEAIRRRVPTPQDDYAGIVATIRDLVRGAEEELGARDLPVGIAMPGAISPATGLVKNANTTCLIGRPLQEDLERALERPLRLANDANCFALSEAVDGAGAGAHVVFGVILGTGVGGGVVVGRRVLTGPNAVAGEWGHNPLPWPRDDERPGPECYCGKRGCIETWLSGPAIARAHERRTGEARSTVDLAAAADPEAIRTLQDTADRLARALATVIDVLDPDAIVLGGGVSNIATLYAEVPRRWSDYAFSDTVATPLLQNHHGDSGGVRGAAWLWPAEA